jgi:hypothetical protein
MVRGKALGALTGHRTLLFLVISPWLFGLALRAQHFIRLLHAITGQSLFLCFGSALGTLFSLRSRTPGQPLTRTLDVLLMLNLGTAVAGVLSVGSREFGAMFGSTAAVLLAHSDSFHLGYHRSTLKGSNGLAFRYGLLHGLCGAGLEPLPGRDPRVRRGRRSLFVV